MTGFALLRLCDEPGSLVLSVFWWERSVLHRIVRTLPGCGGPPLRNGNEAERIGDSGEVLLTAHETSACRRHVRETSFPSIGAYSAECCA
jgi:hypothetical protein